MVRLRDHLKPLTCFAMESGEVVSWEDITIREIKYFFG